MNTQLIYENLFNEAHIRFPDKTIIPAAHCFDIYPGFYIDHAEDMNGECTHVFAVFDYDVEGDKSSHEQEIELTFQKGISWNEFYKEHLKEVMR